MPTVMKYWMFFAQKGLRTQIERVPYPYRYGAGDARCNGGALL